MKKLVPLIGLFLFSWSCDQDLGSQNIVSTDISNFWEAYDAIKASRDSADQYHLLDSLYFQKGSAGLKAIRQVRNYSAQDYIEAIHKYPAFWRSIREKTLQTNSITSSLQEGVKGLKALYPEVKPAKIYFTIGALRTNGTTLDSMVLIGSELAFADRETPSQEFPSELSYLRSYFETEPFKNLVFLNIHEYVHTQQKSTIGRILLAQTIIEGVAEFVAEQALATPSPNPQIEFGLKHDSAIKAKYQREMFSPYFYNWLWNSADNEFGMRDLAYYVGYRICKEYYHQAENKSKALKEMIELDYNDESALLSFVERSTYFDKPLLDHKSDYEARRPQVRQVYATDKKGEVLENVNPETSQISIEFSEAMDQRFRNFNYGPLGQEASLRIEGLISWSENGKTLCLEIGELKPGHRYQLILGEGFRNLEGIALKEYLIDFETSLE